MLPRKRYTRGTFKDQGHEYEVKVSMDLCLKDLYDPTVEDFEALSNVESTGSCDDIIYMRKVDDKWKTDFFQLKHIKNPKGEFSFKFLMKNGTIDLKKESNSIKELNTFLKNVETKDLFMGDFAESNIILFTNATLNKALANISVSHKASYANTSTRENVFIFEGNNELYAYLKDAEYGEEYYKKLLFHIGQGNANKIEMDIKEILSKVYHKDLILDLSNNLYKDFEISYTSGLSINKRYLKYKISELICRQIMMKSVNKVPQIKVQFSEESLREFTMIISDGSQNLYSNEAHVFLQEKVIQCVSMCPTYVYFNSDYVVLYAEELKTQLMYTDDGILIIDLEDKIPDTSLQSAVAFLLEENLKIIILSTQNLTQYFHLNNAVLITTHYKNLDHNSRTNISTQQLSFQGKPVPFTSVLSEESPGLHGQKLLDLCEGKIIKIGDAIEQEDVGYIPRYLELMEVFVVAASEILCSLDWFIVIVSENLDEEVMKIWGMLPKFEKKRCGDQDTWTYQNLVLITDTQEHESTVHRLSQTRKSIHVLVVNNERLKWIRSYGEPIEERLITTSSKTIPQHLIFNENRLIFVVGEPGIGKSALLRNLTSDLKHKHPTKLLLYVDLSLNCKLLHEFSFKDIHEVITFLQNNFEKESFGRDILERFLETREQVVVLLDGYDKVSPFYTYKVDKITQILLEHTKVQNIIISCDLSLECNNSSCKLRPLHNNMSSGLRPLYDNMSSELRPLHDNMYSELRPLHDNMYSELRPLRSISYKLRPLDNENEQKQILLSCIKKTSSNTSTETIEKFSQKIISLVKTSGKKRDILSLENPFHIKIITEALIPKNADLEKVELPKSIDYLKLYQYFIEEKLSQLTKDFSEEKKANVRWKLFVESWYDSIKESCMKAACITQMPDIFEGCDETERFVTNMEEMLNCGFVSQVEDGIVFNNTSIGHYFLALWFYNNWETTSISVRKKLFQQEFTPVKYFFDLMMTEKHPTLYKIITHDNIEVCMNLHEKDATERNALHFSVMYKNVEATRVILQSTGSEFVEAKDEILNWEPIQYIREIITEASINIAGMLLQKNADTKNLQIFSNDIKNNLELIISVCTKNDYLNLYKYINNKTKEFRRRPSRNSDLLIR